jgi:hypothetical protein
LLGAASRGGCAVAAATDPATQRRPYTFPMSKKTLYKVTFLNHGKVYELYAQRVASGALWGFTEVAELVFDLREGVVVDPTEERLRDEFGDTRVLHLPMQSIVRIEEVEKKGQSAIRDAATGEAVVTPFPMPAKPR